uniref:Uncharacterized protein n=1 Tax=Knipowitschia caucasica TaxID=637954 RepID=A0AAV2J898_KNICA
MPVPKKIKQKRAKPKLKKPTPISQGFENDFAEAAAVDEDEPEEEEKSMQERDKSDNDDDEEEEQGDAQEGARHLLLSPSFSLFFFHLSILGDSLIHLPAPTRSPAPVKYNGADREEIAVCPFALNDVKSTIGQSVRLAFGSAVNLPHSEVITRRWHILRLHTPPSIHSTSLTNEITGHDHDHFRQRP